MAEKLTPPEGSVDTSERREILMDLAKALKKQGSFQLASKKYTLAGDRIRAIKCLVRSGDTNAVISYASKARNPEIYTLAANYLQQMNWRASIDIMKAIITFYTKAKSFIQLAGFYDSCAQAEIDEYGAYDKAVGALNEAIKYLAKDNSKTAVDLATAMERRIMLTNKFVEAKEAKSGRDPGKLIAICEALLQDPSVEEAIRIGDVYALLIEHFVTVNDMQEAYHYLQEMQNTRRIQPQQYLEKEMVEQVYKAVGAKPAAAAAAAAGRGGEGKRRDEEEEDESMIDEDLSMNNSPVKKSSRPAPKQPMRQQQEDDDEVDEEIAEEVDEEVDSPKQPKRGGGGGRYGQQQSGTSAHGMKRK
jgi:intraflagellar transport protein 140